MRVPLEERQPPSLIASLLALAMMLAGGVAAGVLAWLLGFEELQIGMTLGPSIFASMLVVSGLVGWNAKARFDRGATYTHFDWPMRLVLIFVGLCIFVAAFVLVPMFV